MAPCKLIGATATNVGRKRQNNEDTVLGVPKSRLWIVADGMGGHAGGEVASRKAVDTIATYYKEVVENPDVTSPIGLARSPDMDQVLLDAAIRWANREIYDYAQQNPAFRGMGTTVVALHQTENGDAVIGHLGDSRCYRYRYHEDTLEQLTEDHSFVVEWARMMGVSLAEAAKMVPSNQILKACGLKERVETTTRRVPMQANDLFLLCSDGLTGEVSDKDIADILKGFGEHTHMPSTIRLQRLVDELVMAAVMNGGRDNVTVALVWALNN